MSLLAQLRSLSLLGLASLPACSGGHKVPIFLPTEPAAATPESQTMAALEGDGELLIVDWKSEHRRDLEAAMKEGVAVVSVEAKGLRLVKDCKLDGAYGFLGMTKKESVVQLENGNEVRANLPLSGIDLAAKIEGEMSKGATIDIAMVMVGKVRTTWSLALKGDLVGKCDGATHFVRGATIGAFTMGSSSSKDVSNKDGTVDACQKATPDAAQAPDQCGAPIRLELTALSKGGGRGKGKAVTTVRPACPGEAVLLDGRCTAPSGEKPYPCDEGNLKECTEQCERGSAESCGELAVIHALGQGVPADIARAAGLFEKACGGGDQFSCVELGRMKVQGVGTAQDAPKGVALLEQGCANGVPEGCTSLGVMMMYGEGTAKDPAKAVPILQRGCSGGDDDACSALGSMYLIGLGVGKDVARAAPIFKLACDGKSANACANLAYMNEVGAGVEKSPERAVALYTKSCEADPMSCAWLGMLHETGTGVPQDEAKAVARYKESCGAGDVFACALLNVAHKEKLPIQPELAKAYISAWTDTCKADFGRDCSGLGVMQIATGSAFQGVPSIKRGCKLGDTWACAVQKKLGVGK